MKGGGHTTQPGVQQAGQIQRLVDGINSALDGLVFVVAHAAVGAAHVVVVAAPAIALMWMLVKVGGPRLHQSFRQTRLVAVRIIPPDTATYDPPRYLPASRMPLPIPPPST